MGLGVSTELRELSKSKIELISPNLLIYTKYLGEIVLKVRFLECDELVFRTDYKNVIKELEVGKELASKLRKEMKKIIYQQYNYAFRYYYVNDELDEAANVTLLHKYGLFGKKWEIEDTVRAEELLIEEEKEVYEYYSI